MPQPKASPTVLPFRPRPADHMKAIRALAQDSSRVFFGKHARDRMWLRGVTDREAIQVLKIGEIKGEISPGRKAGEWKCKVVAKLKGSREIGVITVTMAPNTLLVKTVEWEDP